ncbi:MAG: hypothetical protein ABI180_09160 [Microcoleus sp.]|jgi:Uma2 family endonuclease
MVQTKTQLTFADFLQNYLDGAGIYELVNGEIVKVESTRADKNVARYLARSFHRESERLRNDHYVVQSFRDNERIISPTFPELEITVEQILLSSQVQTL